MKRCVGFVRRLRFNNFPLPAIFNVRIQKRQPHRLVLRLGRIRMQFFQKGAMTRIRHHLVYVFLRNFPEILRRELVFRVQNHRRIFVFLPKPKIRTNRDSSALPRKSIASRITCPQPGKLRAFQQLHLRPALKQFRAVQRKRNHPGRPIIRAVQVKTG